LLSNLTRTLVTGHDEQNARSLKISLCLLCNQNPIRLEQILLQIGKGVHYKQGQVSMRKINSGKKI